MTKGIKVTTNDVLVAMKSADFDRDGFLNLEEFVKSGTKEVSII